VTAFVHTLSKSKFTVLSFEVKKPVQLRKDSLTQKSIYTDSHFEAAGWIMSAALLITVRSEALLDTQMKFCNKVISHSKKQERNYMN
jgi:hypothetical protein